MPDDDTSTPAGVPFAGVLCLEGVMTSDGRTIGLNETSWRELPLSLMVMTKASHGGAPSTETVVGGVIETLERVSTGDGTAEIRATGRFDTGEHGAEAARLNASKALRGVSIDFAAKEEVRVTEEDEDGYPLEVEVVYSEVEILAATLCPMPAFAGAYLDVVQDTAAEPVEDDEAATSELVDLVASAALPGLRAMPCEPCGSERTLDLVAAGGPVEPPAAWFEQPDLDGPTPLTISDTGRVFGHLATWTECHVGIDGRCVTPPRSASNYAHFRVASTHTAEGTRVPTGVLFMGTSHASTRGGLSVSAVQDHYADTGTATADVAAGEDAHGVWVAGAMRPGLTPEQVRAARGSVLSGDWRSKGGRLELVAALHVNVPGFAVPHAELVASAAGPEVLVAAGARAAEVLARRERTEEPSEVLLDRVIDRALARREQREQTRARAAAALGRIVAHRTADPSRARSAAARLAAALGR